MAVDPRWGGPGATFKIPTFGNVPSNYMIGGAAGIIVIILLLIILKKKGKIFKGKSSASGTSTGSTGIWAWFKKKLHFGGSKNNNFKENRSGTLGGT
ncbi:MAG: hypothetical protein ABIF92_00265, partial [archaeon]